jgi:hypothetical protein
MAAMYTALLIVHSWTRWIVLVLAVLAVARALRGLAAKTPWSTADESASRWFVTSLDIQMLIGLIIYIALSPFAMAGVQDMAGTMRNAPLRFIVVEHPVGMIAAIALAHIGRARSRRAVEAARKHRLAALFFGIALLVMLWSIPWPFMPSGRELFRGL